MSQRIALDEALIGFGPNDVTVRVSQAIMGVLPGVSPVAGWRSVEEAATALHQGAPAGLTDRARLLACEKEGLNALLIANALDQGDKGITIYTGLSTAASFFFGKKAGLQADAQQRSDAAIKALALALLVHRLIPGPPEDAIWTLRSLPTGNALLHYYGAVEIALPFVEEAIAADGKFVSGLLAAEVGGVVTRLQAVAGKDGIAAAQAILPTLTPVLEEMATGGLAHVGTLAETVKSFLPSMLGAARDALPDLVATGADTLPMYQFFVSRLIAEAVLAKARQELDPSWRPAPERVVAAPAPAAAPLPDGANPFAEPVPAGANPFAEPMAAPSPAVASSADPFATPFAAPVAGAASVAAVAAVARAPLSLAGLGMSSTETVLPETHDDPEPAAAPEPAPAPQPAPKAAGRVLRAAPNAAADAPPAPPRPPSRATPTLILSAEEAAEMAEEEELDVGEPLSGSYVHRIGGNAIWLIFTRDGRFTNHPPVKPAPIDWEAHERAGHAVGRYSRTGDELMIRWASGKENKARITVDDHGITVDGRACKRADWDLSGGALRGTWRPEGEDQGGYWFSPDGRFTEADDEEHGGTYVLGTASIELRWDEGGAERLALLSDLEPNADAPDLLWLAGAAFERKP